MPRRMKSRSTSPKAKSDTGNLFRQWRILTILGPRDDGMTVKELAAVFDSPQRKIQRDLTLLQNLGFPLESTTGAHGRKTWRRTAGVIPSINLNLTEAAALYLGRKLMEPLAGTDLWVGAQEAFQKFECSFEKRTLKFLAKLAQAFHATRFGNGNYSNYGQIIDTLMIAIEDRNVLTLAYHSADVTEPVTRDVNPYHLVFHKGSLYLVAWAVEREMFRNYKVDRIASAEIKPKSLPFNVTEFDLEQYLSVSTILRCRKALSTSES